MKSQGRFDRSGGESEQQWANRNFVHLKALKEVEKLEVEVFERLRRQGIVDHKVELLKQEDERVVPFILKVCADQGPPGRGVECLGVRSIKGGVACGTS